ncbi:MAG TPA: Fic family protein [Verrucomicrobiae bacterium]|nr:Fic family protein [Verrucomicrobiae bacterium]
MEYQTQLKSILQASGWTQEELARQLDVSFVTLNAWINGKSEPRKKAQDAIQALYFDIVGFDSINQETLGIQKKAASRLHTTARAIAKDKAVLNKLILHLTYHTNTIEGSTMTLADTEEVLFNNQVLANRTQIEQVEARNHQAALLWLLDGIQTKGFALTEDIVKGLHLRLMNGILSDAGQYRRHSVRIMGTRVTVANYLKVPDLMADLMKNISNERQDVITGLAQAHAVFEKIHPFSDGNGRVGRLIMLAQALQVGNIPPLVLKEKRRAYYKYLEMAQTKEELGPLEFFIAESIQSSNHLLFDD